MILIILLTRILLPRSSGGGVCVRDPVRGFLSFFVSFPPFYSALLYLGIRIAVPLGLACMCPVLLHTP